MKTKPKAPLLLLPMFIIVSVAYLFYLAGDGSYRYPCQDPLNFGAPECEPPICLADGTCTDMLLKVGD